MWYRSPATFLNLPLIHVAIGPEPGSDRTRGIARGWIAVGDLAFGVVFALGGLAVGGISLGGLSLGLLAIAGASFGVWSFGGLAVGIWCLGGAAFAVTAGVGGLAVAGKYAVGGEAVAPHANDDVARAYFQSSPFFRRAESAAQHARWLILLPLLTPLLIRKKKDGESPTKRGAS